MRRGYLPVFKQSGRDKMVQLKTAEERFGRICGLGGLGNKLSRIRIGVQHSQEHFRGKWPHAPKMA
jgi:hypothetical protein